MDKVIKIQSDDYLIEDTDFYDDVSLEFSSLPDVAKPLMIKAKDTLSEISGMLYTAPSFINMIKANVPKEMLTAVLTDDQKDVFKTFEEISPKDIIDLAADRQKYIDMGQSLNLVKRPNYSIKDLYDMHKYAFSKGIKTLYYMYPSSHAVLEKSGQNWDECSSCAD